jgi:hypothetical protein
MHVWSKITPTYPVTHFTLHHQHHQHHLHQGLTDSLLPKTSITAYRNVLIGRTSCRWRRWLTLQPSLLLDIKRHPPLHLMIRTMESNRSFKEIFMETEMEEED